MGAFGTFGTIWRHLGAIWGHLGTWGPSGAIWGHLGTLGPFREIWGHLVPFGDIWGTLGPFGIFRGIQDIWGHLGHLEALEAFGPFGGGDFGAIWGHLGLWGHLGVFGTPHNTFPGLGAPRHARVQPAQPQPRCATRALLPEQEATRSLAPSVLARAVDEGSPAQVPGQAGLLARQRRLRLLGFRQQLGG